MNRIAVPTLLTAGGVVLLLLAYALTFQVRFSEVAVTERFGKADEKSIVTDPGLYWRWPWPIDRVTKYDKRLRTLDTTEAEVKTKDGKNVVIGNYAIWRIEQPLQFYKRVRTVAKAEEGLRARIADRRQAVIGNENLSAFVNLDEARVTESYDRIEEALLNGKGLEPGGETRSLAEGVLEDFGIHLEKVAIRRISLPQETTQSVFQQMIAERQKVAAGYREEGKSRAQSITAAAEAAKQQILAFARTKAEQERTKGVQASTRVLAQIEAEDVEFFEWLRWLDALRVSLQQKSTIFLDSDSELFKPFMGPLAPTSQPGRE
ncbi:MAG: protease modulator HflC [Phycisphaerae bacterium]|jgi:membrane protease subunit HflC